MTDDRLYRFSEEDVSPLQRNDSLTSDVSYESMKVETTRNDSSQGKSTVAKSQVMS